MFFRRHRSPFPHMEAKLRTIVPEGQYEMSLAHDFDAQPTTRVSGKELAKMTIHIPAAPGSVLLRYQR